MSNFQAVIEQTFLNESSRVLATLIGRLGDFALAEDVRQAFAKIGIEHATGRHGNVVTVSAGVAVLEPAGKKNRRELLRAADAALYAAKAKGKNTVVHSA